MSAFKVGDVCVIVADGEWNGHECTVVGPLEWCRTWDRRSPKAEREGYQHAIDIPGQPHHWYALPSELRLKRPPTKDDAEPLLDHVPCEGDWLEDFKRSMKGKVTTHG